MTNAENAKFTFLDLLICVPLSPLLILSAFGEVIWKEYYEWKSKLTS
jgi:hypothetical protein